MEVYIVCHFLVHPDWLCQRQWEATSKFKGWSVCTEGMIYHMSQDLGENLGGGFTGSPEFISSDKAKAKWSDIPSTIWMLELKFVECDENSKSKIFAPLVGSLTSCSRFLVICSVH